MNGCVNHSITVFSDESIKRHYFAMEREFYRNTVMKEKEGHLWTGPSLIGG